MVSFRFAHHLLQALQNSLESSQSTVDGSSTAFSILIPSNAVAQFHAISPRGTRSALVDLDQHISKTPPQSPQINRPALFILQGLVTIYVCQPFVAFVIGLDHRSSNCDDCSSRPNNPHVVTLRDVRFDNQRIVACQSDSDLNDAHCDCKAFLFRPPDEAYCKHIITAIIAAGLSAAPITHLPEAQFLNILKGSDSQAPARLET